MQKDNEDNEVKIKAGIEIHQQLDTHKLFCHCPSILRNDKPEYEIKRKLHAVAGETGEIDIAAEYEVGKDMEFIYQGYDTNCLVELDEEPPYEINKEALQIAVQISLLLNCEILNVSQIMRKTVIDGSNTAGFQRTILIARNGFIKTSFGKVGIDNIQLEEDSARLIEKKNNEVIFRLDRLGIPLVEIGTCPDIKNPEQAKEVALILGDILRACKVKRGIGTIRQDVNISIENHPRVEIKGFQDVRNLVSVLENEIKRQEENLKLKKGKSEVRKAEINGTTSFLRPMPGASRMYPETDLPLLKIDKKFINEAKKQLPKLREEHRKELRKKGLNEEAINILLKSGKLGDFGNLLKILNEPKFIYKALIEIPKEISSHYKIENIDEKLSLDIIENIIQGVASGRLGRQDIKHIIEEIVKGKNLDEALKIEKKDLTEIESEIVQLIKEKPGLSKNAYMGLVMQKHKGKVSGIDIMNILEKLVR